MTIGSMLGRSALGVAIMLAACAGPDASDGSGHPDNTPAPGVDAGANATVTPGTPQLPVYYTELDFAPGLADPDAPPAGANVVGCYSAEHPRPVILVHGTFENEHDNWATLSPLLWNHGFCVYTFNYGGPPLLGAAYGISEIAASAGELATFVEQVRAQTGASKVDLVGHSQGGMMPRYYLKFLGGAAEVENFVAISPSSHGTTVFGLTQLASLFSLGSVLDGGVGAVSEACAEQLTGSPFLAQLNASGDAVPGVHITVLASETDEVVTPYTSQFLSGSDVTNLKLQDSCPIDFSGHVGIVFDQTALQLVLNALDPTQAKTPVCWPVPFAG